jgi:hypothetical protein
MSGPEGDDFSGQLDKAGMGIEDGLPLNVSSGGIEELRADIQRLMDIEAIKQLKHAYFRCLDTANFKELEQLFHDDVTVDFVGGSYEWKLNGKDEYLASLRKSFTREAVGHHNGHHPEIQMLSENEATGIWYLADDMWILTHKFHTKGTAMYWDRYVKADGRWKIRETRYRRLYETSGLLAENPTFSSHHLAKFGTEV